MVPGPGPLMPLSQVPTALGRESSISGPSDEADAPDGSVIEQADVRQARPTPILISATRRVTDRARLLVSSPHERGADCPPDGNEQILSRGSSSWLFITFHFVCFLVSLF